jgi:hypothetical protein
MVVRFDSLEVVPSCVADEGVLPVRANEALDAAQDVSTVSVRESARQIGDNCTSSVPPDAVRAPAPEKPISVDGGIVVHEVVSRTGADQVAAVTATQKVPASASVEPISTRTAAHQVVASACANAIAPSAGDDDVPGYGTDQVIVSARADDRRSVPEAGLRSGRGRRAKKCERTDESNRAKLRGLH